MRMKREDERVEIRRKMWLCERAILVLPRLMQKMIKAGEIGGTVRSDC